MLRTALAVLAAATAPVPHYWHGWGPTGLPAALTAYTAVIDVPDAPPAGTAYAWVMAEDPGGSAFTQIGMSWAPSTSSYPGPVLFAYTVPVGGIVSPSDWVYGEQLTPGQALSVRITRTGTTYADQVLWQGSWATLDTGTLPRRPLWSTMEETYGLTFTVCFTGRSYQVGNVTRSMPSGCQP